MIFILSCLLNNQRINCFDGIYNKEQLKKWADKNILLCPACGKPYEYCHGRVIQPYFRHKDKAQCEDRYSEPETKEHLQGKRDLYEWIKKQQGVTDVILEGWIPETKQRPDIMFKYNGKQCVMEFQCSPISTEYYERHELYQAAGIEDIWICGTDKYFGENKRFDTLEKECGIYYNVRSKNIIKSDSCLYNVPEFLEKYHKEYYYSSIEKIERKKESRYYLSKGKKFYFYFMDEIEFQNKIIFKTDLKNNYEDIYNKTKNDMLININNMIYDINNDDLDISFIKESLNKYKVTFKNIKNEIKVIETHVIKIDVLNEIYFIDNYGYNNFDNFKENFLEYVNNYLNNLDYRIKDIEERRFYKDLSSQLVKYIESIKNNYYNYLGIDTNSNSSYYKYGISVNFNGFCYGIFIKNIGIDFASLKTNNKFSRWKNIEKNVDLNDIDLLKEKIRTHLNNSMAAFNTKYLDEYLSKYNNKLWSFNVDCDDFITTNYCITISRKYDGIIIAQKDIKINKNNINFGNIKNLLKDKMEEINKELVDKKDGYYIKGEHIRFLGVDNHG